jgi:hypothetical protein
MTLGRVYTILDFFLKLLRYRNFVNDNDFELFKQRQPGTEEEPTAFYFLAEAQRGKIPSTRTPGITDTSG